MKYYNRYYRDNQDLVDFEGEYLDGKKINGAIFDFNGKLFGKIEKGIYKLYYNDGKLKYEGEIYKGRKWKGKEYGNDENEVYEIKCGNGYRKEYDVERNIKLESEYLNGKRNGKGKDYLSGKLVFDGEYLEGKRNGKGKEYTWKEMGFNRIKNILIFEGDYSKGYRNGKGKEYHENGNIKFDGEYLDGKSIIIVVNYFSKENF